MDKHPLHKAVGNLLKEFADKHKLETRLDPACGINKSGKQHIPLFLGAKSSSTRLCCVDAMLLKNGEVAAVIEIEESNIKPTQICGKYMTTALSKKYIHKNESLDMKDISFIQILDIGSPRKREQAENINSLTQKDFRCGCVKNYHLICVDWEEHHDMECLKNKLYKILRGI
jgi:hypothetical protein